MLHRMRTAKPSPKTARARGLNANHSLRVWCTCMDDPIKPPGYYAGTSPTTVSDRSVAQAANDPRRLWSYDSLGVVDMRVPNSALDLWRRHVEECTDEAAQD